MLKEIIISIQAYFEADRVLKEIEKHGGISIVVDDVNQLIEFLEDIK